MEDYALDIIIGKGPSARSLRIDLEKFTLIGATTRTGQLTGPLRDRFGLMLSLDLYSLENLQKYMLLHPVCMLKMTNIAPFVIIM